MHLQRLMAEREKTGSVVDVASLKKDWQLLQQDSGMMRYSVSSQFAGLEGTVPNAKAMNGMGTQLVDMEAAVIEIHKDMKNMGRGM
eukprot:12896554-Prorocentrum_lima.AAC.1